MYMDENNMYLVGWKVKTMQVYKKRGLWKPLEFVCFYFSFSFANFADFL